MARLWAAFSHRGRITISPVELFLTLLLFIVITPFLDVIPHGVLIQTVILTFVLLSAVSVVAANRTTLILAIAFAIPAFVGKWANYFRPDIVPAEAFLAATLVFVAFVVLSLFRFILRAARVDIQVLAVATSNYLMIGLLWMFVYLLLAEAQPNAFHITSGPSDGLMNSFNALYFSFVTLCTVGYGDITPMSKPARMLAVLEATTGIFYVTIVIARLVALYTTESVDEGRHIHE